jgi:uncharacterized protein (DUF305 family)
MEHSHKTMEHSKEKMHGKHYKALAVMGLLSFICMYILMYAMTNTIKNVFPNVNQFYMAGLMAMPMIIIEIILMRHMYMNKKLNLIIMGFSSIALIAFYLLIRQQTGVSDRQFLRSMIPHHSGAILMCEKADIQDPEIKKLCEEIIASQQREIDQMKTKLNELDKGKGSETAKN